MTRTDSASRPATAAPPSASGAASSDLWRLAGLGATMTSEILGGFLVGFGLDYAFKTSPWFTIFFSLAGLIIGMRSFIRAALGASGAASREAGKIVAAGGAPPLEESDGLDDPEAIEAALRAAGADEADVADEAPGEVREPDSEPRRQPGDHM